MYLGAEAKKESISPVHRSRDRQGRAATMSSMEVSIPAGRSRSCPGQCAEVEALAQRIADAVAVRMIGRPFNLEEAVSA